MDGWMAASTDGWTGGGWIDGGRDERIHRWTDAWMHVWIEDWTAEMMLTTSLLDRLSEQNVGCLTGLTECKRVSTGLFNCILLVGS